MEGKIGRSPFLDSVRDAIRVKHYSYRTEQTYVQWVKRFILFSGKRHPSEMGEAEIAAFLTDLAVERRVSPGTQNQALNALVFLYKHVLRRPLGDIVGAVRAKRRQRLPVVLTPSEVGALLDHLEGVYWLTGCLLYGSGLRLRESVGLRARYGGTTFMPPLSRKRLSMPCGERGLRSRRHVTPCVTPSRHIFSSAEWISAPSKSSSGTAMSRRRKSIRTSSSGVGSV